MTEDHESYRERVCRKIQDADAATMVSFVRRRLSSILNHSSHCEMCGKKWQKYKP